MSGSEMISGLIDKLMSNNSDNEFSCLSSNNAKHLLLPSSQIWEFSLFSDNFEKFSTDQSKIKAVISCSWWKVNNSYSKQGT